MRCPETMNDPTVFALKCFRRHMLLEICSKCEILLKCCPKCEKVLKGVQNANSAPDSKKCSKGAQRNRERPNQFIPFFGFGSVRGSQKKRKECHFTFYLNTYKNVARKMARGVCNKILHRKAPPVGPIPNPLI